MKRKMTAFCAACCLLTGLAACGNTTTPPTASQEEAAATEATTEKIFTEICYVTGHGETDPANYSAFRTQLEADGFTWTEITLDAIPAEADALIISAPQEDITPEELAFLDEYMDTGGNVVMLHPASDKALRYKYLDRFMEEFCIVFDYDILSETDEGNYVGEDEHFIFTDLISYPDTMPLYGTAVGTGQSYLPNARSLYLTYAEHYGSVKMDVMLRTSETVVGTPYGGVEDDPLTYEETSLPVMAFARDDKRKNACVIAVGANEFLTDANYMSEHTDAACALIHSSFDWFATYDA